MQELLKKFDEKANYTNEYGYVHKIPKYDEMKELLLSAYTQGVKDAIEVVEERMFQIRENGTGETYKIHKELSDTLSTLSSLTTKNK